MEYRVEELARAADSSVDTIRFYQGKGLLSPPLRRGRCAIYRDSHLDRLRTIRELSERGFSLALIKRALDGAEAPPNPAAEKPLEPADAELLSTLVVESLGPRGFLREELALEAGVPEEFVRAVQAAGLLSALRVDGEERWSAADLEMLRTGHAILNAGFPLDQFLELAGTHAGNTRAMVDQAIELFDRHLRKGPGAQAAPEATSEAFKLLLPQVTKLVALHFQRTLVARALARLAGNPEDPHFESALAALESARLEVSWR